MKGMMIGTVYFRWFIKDRGKPIFTMAWTGLNCGNYYSRYLASSLPSRNDDNVIFIPQTAGNVENWGMEPKQMNNVDHLEYGGSTNTHQGTITIHMEKYNDRKYQIESLRRVWNSLRKSVDLCAEKCDEQKADARKDKVTPEYVYNTPIT